MLVALLLSPALLQEPGPDPSILFGDRWTPEARVYLTAGPSVVSITLHAKVVVKEGFGRRREELRILGQGTGVVIDSEGLVITNRHVADAGPEIHPSRVVTTVTFAEEFGGREYPAHVLSVDQESDLALLKIEGRGPFRASALGSSRNLIKGEKVVAIGAPFGNSHSVTSGILSGLHRKVKVRTQRGGAHVFQDLLQTDAAINPGNSGGPLLNVSGELIGINVATREGADGLGFAIPVDRIKEVLAQSLFDLSHRFWAGLRIREEAGTPVVTSVHPRGPAREAGLQDGDRILSVAGESIQTPSDYASLLLSRNSGEHVLIGYARNGEIGKVDLQLRPAHERNTVGLLGFEARPVRIPYRRGLFRESLPVLRIEKVHPDSPGQALGLKTGDLLIAARLECEDPDAGWQPVSTLASLVSMVRGPGFETGSPNLWILRGEESLQGCIQFDDPELELARASS
jgi:serine protease Do